MLYNIKTWTGHEVKLFVLKLIIMYCYIVNYDIFVLFFQ